MRLRAALTGTLVLLLCAGGAAAQVYKWKDAKGVTHFSDQPPPPAARPASKVELKSYPAGAAAPALPFELAEAVKNHPVTLYTTGQCEACDQGRAMLQARGIPLTEKTVDSAADQAALQQAGGGNQLPLLLVGRNKLTGYERGAWDAALAAASYPAQRMLPSSYQAARATPAAPRPAVLTNPGAAPAAASESPPERLPPLNAPPDFQF